jgi:hypothetical protein
VERARRWHVPRLGHGAGHEAEDEHERVHPCVAANRALLALVFGEELGAASHHHAGMSGTRKAKVGEDVRRAGFVHSVSSGLDEDALADAGDKTRVQMVSRQVLNALLDTALSRRGRSAATLWCASKVDAITNPLITLGKPNVATRTYSVYKFLRSLIPPPYKLYRGHATTVEAYVVPTFFTEAKVKNEFQVNLSNLRILIFRPGPAPVDRSSLTLRTHAVPGLVLRH